MDDDKWKLFTERLNPDYNANMMNFISLTNNLLTSITDYSSEAIDEFLAVIWKHFTDAIDGAADDSISYKLTPKTVVQTYPNRSNDLFVKDLTAKQNLEKKLRLLIYSARRNINQSIPPDKFIEHNLLISHINHVFESSIPSLNSTWTNN
jgi:hypothetical protein